MPAPRQKACSALRRSSAGTELLPSSRARAALRSRARRSCSASRMMVLSGVSSFLRGGPQSPDFGLRQRTARSGACGRAGQVRQQRIHGQCVAKVAVVGFLCRSHAPEG